MICPMCNEEYEFASHFRDKHSKNQIAACLWMNLSKEEWWKENK